MLFVSARHRYCWEDDIQFHIVQEHKALKLKKETFLLKKNYMTRETDRPIKIMSVSVLLFELVLSSALSPFTILYQSIHFFLLPQKESHPSLLFVSARHRYCWEDDIQFHIVQEHKALKLKKETFLLKKNYMTRETDRPIKIMSVSVLLFELVLSSALSPFTILYQSIHFFLLPRKESHPSLLLRTVTN